MTPLQRRQFLLNLPLADLHRHFDGSLRPQTLWELSKKYYSAVPGLDYEAFRHYLQWDPSQDRTLLDYLDKFHVPLQYTQFYDNIKRMAFEIAEDAHREGVRLDGLGDVLEQDGGRLLGGRGAGGEQGERQGEGSHGGPPGLGRAG